MRLDLIDLESLDMRGDPPRGMAAIAGGVVNPGFNDPRQPERWDSDLKLVEEILTQAPEVAELPLIMRLTSHLGGL
jgi:hypothetical protein